MTFYAILSVSYFIKKNTITNKQETNIVAMKYDLSISPYDKIYFAIDRISYIWIYKTTDTVAKLQYQE